MQGAAFGEGRTPGSIESRRPFTVMATLRREGRDVRDFLDQAWIVYRLDAVMASLFPIFDGCGQPQPIRLTFDQTRLYADWCAMLPGH
jgi:hypothetical protein